MTTGVYKFMDDQIKEALIESRGSFSAAAVFLRTKYSDSCTRDYVKRRVSESEYLTEAFEEIRDAIVDKAEDNIFVAVEQGDFAASNLVVRTLGKDRGWVPKEEVEGKLSGESLVAAVQRGRERLAEAKAAQTKAVSDLEQPTVPDEHSETPE